jgi:hypothetical protein
MKLTGTLACCLTLALVGVAPAAAEVPYEARWKQAAKKARFAAVPAPSERGAFSVFEQGPGGTGGIKGAYERVRIGIENCASYLSQRVAGYFRRSTDGATMEMIYERRYPRACPHPGGKRTRVRRIRVLGVRMGVWRVRYSYPTEPVYEVRGTLRRRDLRLSVVGGNVDDTVRIAQSLRWVRR